MVEITSPVTGSVLEISIIVGDTVSTGEQLLVLESMKMEFPIEAPCDGTVATISVDQGTAVQPGELLITLC